MNSKKLKDLIEIFMTVQVTKELPRQGFLYSGFKRNEADSVAAHSFSVTLFSYLFAKELKAGGWDINPDRALKIAMVHDLGETITGDIGTYAKSLARDVFDTVEMKAFSMLVRNNSNKDELIELLEEYQKLESKEAKIVKFADSLDAFLQGFNTPGADKEDLEQSVLYISEKKIKDKELGKLLRSAIKMITTKKVSIFKDFYFTHEVRNEKL